MNQIPKIQSNLAVAKKRITYAGVLDTYWETGYEDGVLAHLYIDKFSSPNSQYNPQDPKSGPSEFRSHEGIINLDFGDILEIVVCPHLPELNGKKYLIGNLDLAKKDNFKFGRAYPADFKDLKKWHSLFSGQTKAKVHKLIKKLYLYGGTFDPVHIGHKQVISEVHYQADEVLVLVGDNWTKDNKPLFTLDERINSVKAVAAQFLNVTVLDWAKTSDTSSTFDVATRIKEEYGFYPTIVIGTDNVSQLNEWKYWDKLKELTFAVVQRKGVDSNYENLKDVPHLFLRGEIEMSSTAIKTNNWAHEIPPEAKPSLDLSKMKKTVSE